jgi:hypothetical protein
MKDKWWNINKKISGEIIIKNTSGEILINDKWQDINERQVTKC